VVSGLHLLAAGGLGQKAKGASRHFGELRALLLLGACQLAAQRQLLTGR